MRFLIGVAAAMALAGAIGLPAAAQPPPRGDIEAGQRLALRVCDACHVVASNQETAPLVQRYAPSFFDIARRPGTTAPSMAAYLAQYHPRGNMPYPDLTAAQVADIGAYILSLKGRR